jgi:hypothetical protein
VIRGVIARLIDVAGKAWRWLWRAAHRLYLKSSKQFKATRSDARVAAIRAGDGVTRWRGGLVRTRRRAERFHEMQVEPYLEQWGIERQLTRIAAGSGPIIAGPWLSEVGYEALYWVPFLRWFADRWGVAASRLIVVSRGGTASWYQGVADRYVEMLDLVSPAEFARKNEERRSSGDQKQLHPGSIDQELLAMARRSLGIGGAQVLHPSLMFQLFRGFWFGKRPLDFVLRRTRFAPLAVAPAALNLPTPYVAVKFYTGPALPDTPANRGAIRALIQGANRDAHIVNLDTGIALDEHQDYLFDDLPVTSIRAHLTPRDNLAVQTAVIAGASAFLGTCGGLAWLAPMLGVPTVAAYSDDRFLLRHLYVAPYAYRAMKAAPFTTVDVAALDGLGARRA